MFIHSQDIKQNHSLTSIKGGNSVANLQKKNDANLAFVNDNVYTKFG